MKNKTIKLKDLADRHPYYCCDVNYYSNKAAQRNETFEEFLDEWSGADLDYNLLFRWDVIENDEDEKENTYFFKAFFILQRKGIFMPVHVDVIEEKDVPSLLEFLKPYQCKMQKIWEPLSLSDV